MNTPRRTASAIDLGVAIAVFLALNASLTTLDPVLRRGRGLTGVLLLAGYQFALEGLAPLIIVIVRRERLSDYGISRRNAGISVALGVALAVLYDLGLSAAAHTLIWIPFRKHSAIRMSRALDGPEMVAGFAITILVWGFAESAFGVFFSRKLDDALGRTGRGWMSPGVIGFATFNGVIHLAIGQGIAGFITSFASGYAIAVIPAVTGNAWGSAVVQILTNAVGPL